MHFYFIGFYLKTRNFLQPLERVGKNNSTVGAREISAVEKPLLIEQILPGGIGTYNICHNPAFGHAVVKPERSAFTVFQEIGMERYGESSKTISNCSSYNQGGFTPWDESAPMEKSVVKDKVVERQLTRGTFCLASFLY